MSDSLDPVWERIADALERIAPAKWQEPDWLSAPAYLWDGEAAKAVAELNVLPLDDLRGIEVQKVALRDNYVALASGAAAHDMMLWGARGMGKSALVRSVMADVQLEYQGAIALVQVMSNAIETLPDLLMRLADQNRAFVLFCDDLTFDEHDAKADLALRSLLDGGVISRLPHIRFAITSNRRTLTRQTDWDDTTSTHTRDERDNFLALADRFGLNLGFHPCDQETYLEIIHVNLDPIGVTFDEGKACAWTVERGNRSGRTAYQFAIEMAGRAGKALKS